MKHLTKLLLRVEEHLHLLKLALLRVEEHLHLLKLALLRLEEHLLELTAGAAPPTSVEHSLV